jgi:hypothetical protein
MSLAIAELAATVKNKIRTSTQPQPVTPPSVLILRRIA